MDQIEKTFSKKERNGEAMLSFGFRLRNQFGINESYRRAKELEWLESLRQYKGLYDPTVEIDQNASKVYPKLTRSKINIVLSRLHEMLFPESEKNFEIETTPEPKINPNQIKQIILDIIKTKLEDMAARQEAGEEIELKPGVDPAMQVMPSPEELKLAIKKFADERCANMSSVVDDQLLEMAYPEETKRVLRSGLMYGTGIMKGPLINKVTRRKWVATSIAGDFKEEEIDADSPYYKFIRIWDWYPDMSVTEVGDMEGSFERHVMSKHDLRVLAKRDDYYADMILQHITDHTSGDYVPKQWEIDLQSIEVEAGAQRDKSTTITGTSDATMSRTSDRQLGRKYEVLEYWGYVDGHDLEACGINVSDPMLEYAANVWMLGSKPIKAVLFDGALKQYKVFYYEKDETSIFGEGLARVMRHSQLAIAGGARMVLDNAAVVAGPQVEVNISAMQEDSDVSSFYPRKIWYREGRGVEAQYPAIRPLEFNSHIQELLSIVEAFRQFADEETTLPTWMIGQMVNNETAQATSSRMSTINISIKDVVKNFDTFTERIIGDLYSWNMEFNPREDIKGDYKVKARGVESLVMKEIRMQALTQLTSTLTPEEWVYVPTRDLVVEKFKAHDIKFKLRTEEEADKIRQANENSKAQQLMFAQAEADIAYKKAQTMNQLTKAKAANVEAEKNAQTPPEGGDDPRLAEAEVVKKNAETENVRLKGELAARDNELKTLKTAHEMKESERKNTVELIHKDEKHQGEMKMKQEKHKADLEMKKKMGEKKLKEKPVKKTGGKP